MVFEGKLSLWMTFLLWTCSLTKIHANTIARGLNIIRLRLNCLKNIYIFDSLWHLLIKMEKIIDTIIISLKHTCFQGFRLDCLKCNHIKMWNKIKWRIHWALNCISFFCNLGLTKLLKKLLNRGEKTIYSYNALIFALYYSYLQ